MRGKLHEGTKWERRKKKKKSLNTREILTGPADVDAIYQVLKQAGEIRGNSTNSPPTPPTADHPPSGAAPSSSARTTTSSQPCSSSTSGKTNVPPFLTFDSISLFHSRCPFDVARLRHGANTILWLDTCAQRLFTIGILPSSNRTFLSVSLYLILHTYKYCYFFNSICTLNSFLEYLFYLYIFEGRL